MRSFDLLRLFSKHENYHDILQTRFLLLLQFHNGIKAVHFYSLFHKLFQNHLFEYLRVLYQNNMENQINIHTLLEHSHI